MLALHLQSQYYDPFKLTKLDKTTLHTRHRPMVSCDALLCLTELYPKPVRSTKKSYIIQAVATIVYKLAVASSFCHH